MPRHVLTPDLCVIGAGSGGLSVAAGASQLGQDVVLIEKNRMGGDCLNVGCVPSKSLLHIAKTAHSARIAGRLGVDTSVQVSFPQVMDTIQRTIQRIAPMDSIERFKGLGVTVLEGHGRFIDQRTVTVTEASGAQIYVKARYFIVATGSQTQIPPLSGLDQVPFVTAETVWDTRTCPDHLVIIGGGPIGLEMAQAHARLGSRVTVIEWDIPLSKEDPQARAIVLGALRQENIRIMDYTTVTQVCQSTTQSAEEVTLSVRVTGDKRSDIYHTLTGSRLFIATGRRPNTTDVGLDSAGITYSERGIHVDTGLRTSNKRVFAIGDVTGGHPFTHVAAYHATIVLKRILFKIPAREQPSFIPRVTFTDPEVAHVGYTEDEARLSGVQTRVVCWPFLENDRAITEDQTGGFVKLVVTRRGRVIGATVVGQGAGDILQPWCLAVAGKLKLSALAGLVVPYPTRGEVNKRAAAAWYTPRLFSRRTRCIIKCLRFLTSIWTR